MKVTYNKGMNLTKPATEIRRAVFAGYARRYVDEITLQAELGRSDLGTRKEIAMKAWLVVAAAICLNTIFVPTVAPSPESFRVTVASTDANKEAIEALVQQELSAFNAGNVAALTAILTDDVVFDPPRQPAVVGKGAVRAWCQDLFTRFDAQASYAVEELVIDGDLAFDRGVWTESITPKTGGETREVAYGILQVYRRQTDGTWKLARCIWNRDESPAR